MEDQASLTVQPTSNTRIDFFNPEHFQMLQRMSKMFSASELVPEMYKTSSTNPSEKATANCMIALDMAQRIDANVLMVMQNLIIIYGRPSWSSKFLISTVNTCGRFETLKFKFEDLGELKNTEYIEYAWNQQQGKKTPVTKKFTEPLQNIQCTAYTSTKGKGDILESSPISIEMAIKEGWYTKAGSKWKTMPKQMLMYRAASFWTSAYAPELSMGMRTVDEEKDIQDAEFEEIQLTNEDKALLEANKTKIDIKAPEQDSKKSEELTNAEKKKIETQEKKDAEKGLGFDD
ncbi:MAG: recombinase RecT [Labilibaculum sp.]|nr:recombinase RecT [Labilibaculum sp.]MBI9060157.1 recombinase RecT [Labilibaculum sp.]